MNLTFEMMCSLTCIILKIKITYVQTDNHALFPMAATSYVIFMLECALNFHHSISHIFFGMTFLVCFQGFVPMLNMSFIASRLYYARIPEGKDYAIYLRKPCKLSWFQNLQFYGPRWRRKLGRAKALRHEWACQRKR